MAMTIAANCSCPFYMHPAQYYRPFNLLNHETNQLKCVLQTILSQNILKQDNLLLPSPSKGAKHINVHNNSSRWPFTLLYKTAAWEVSKGRTGLVRVLRCLRKHCGHSHPVAPHGIPVGCAAVHTQLLSILRSVPGSLHYAALEAADKAR